MKRILGFILVCLVLAGCGGGGTVVNPGGGDTVDPTIIGAFFPPTVKATRTYPKLVSYFHMMNYTANLPNREEYLAQWDVIILNPQMSKDQHLDIAKIRTINPGIKILAWIPFGQSSEDMEMSTSLGSSLSNYYIKDTHGQYLTPSWGGHVMNPYKNSYAWGNHVIAYIEDQYLDTGLYDGVMFDCMWTVAPYFYSNYGADVNEDGVYNSTDTTNYVDGMNHMLNKLRAERPVAIITGNGGTPWDGSSSYYDSVNGPMAENAYGDEFPNNNYWWTVQWGYYTTVMSKITSRPFYYFVVADLRMGRTQTQAQNATELTAEDKRRFRLGLTTTLMGDGYFGFDRGDCLHGQLWWFDEYNVDLGNPLSGYDTPPNTYRTDLYAAGTYSREFANGSVIVNTTGAAIQVTFAESHRDVSTGETGATFTLPLYDGRIYMKN